MATLHLMVGLPCSGKSMLAHHLEARYNALRLALDDWHIRLYGRDFGDDMDEGDYARHAARHEAVEAIMWDVAARVLPLGVDVILDFGCWVRAERDEYRLKAAQLGAGFRIHYTHAPEAVLLERLRIRNARLPDGAFYIPETKLQEWMQLFEPPSPDELQ